MIASSTPASLQGSMFIASDQMVNSMTTFIPRLIMALIIVVIGLLLGYLVKSLVFGFLRAINISKAVKNSPLERYFEGTGTTLKIETILAEICRWGIIYIFLIAAINLLGLQSVANLMAKILAYVPNIISAFFIFIFGVLVAGLVESLVKSILYGIDPATSRLIGKISSYTVVVFASLAAISELGIAEFFIRVLFVGFVGALSLGIALAVGLGAKDVISVMLTRWYRRESADKPDTPLK